MKIVKTNQIFLIAAVLLSMAGCQFGHNPKKETTSGELIDRDRIIYQTVTIGTQIWMGENLSVSKFRNGDAIPEIKEDEQWEIQTEGAFCCYQNDGKNSGKYGKLYNWFAVTDRRGLCPQGWHIPTDEEWQILADFLGGDKLAGDQMKETGSDHWAAPNNGAKNQSGFTALPGGGRDEYGKFIIDRYGGHWWSSTEDGTADVWVRSIYYGYGSILRDSYNKRSGFSVRCLKE